MNCSQFKDHVSNMCLAGTVVACWSLTYEMASSSPFTVMPNIFELSKFSETFRKKSSRSRSQSPQIIIIIIINFIPRKSIHFVSVLVQWAIDKLKSFREKVYPEDRDPVHLGDGYSNEQYCTTVQKKKYEQILYVKFKLHLNLHRR